MTVLHNDSRNVPQGALAYDAVIIGLPAASDPGLDAAVKQSHLRKLYHKFIGSRVTLAVQLSARRNPHLTPVEDMGNGHIEMQRKEKICIYAGGELSPLFQRHIDIFGVGQIHLNILVFFQLLLHVQGNCHGIYLLGNRQIVRSEIAAAMTGVDDHHDRLRCVSPGYR